MQQKVRELEGKGRLRINRQPDWQDLPPGAAPNKFAAEIAKEAKKQSEKADQNGGPSSKRAPREERSKSRNRREDSEGSHSPNPHERGDQKKKTSKDEEKKGGHAGHGHKHLNPVDFAEGFEDTYIDVPFDGFLLKKHFDYILVDNENVTEYTGKSETKINHMLRIPYKGSLQLVSHLVAQLYYNSRMDHKSEDERVIIDDSIFIRKDEMNECLEFRWVANKKNDIAADCLAYMFSQFPDNKEFDLFQSKLCFDAVDMPKTVKERELELLKKKVLKRVLGVFDDCTYKEDKTNRHLLHFQGRNYEFKVNLETGAVREATEDAIRKRVTSIISNLFEPGNLKYS